MHRQLKHEFYVLLQSNKWANKIAFQNKFDDKSTDFSFSKNLRLVLILLCITMILFLYMSSSQYEFFAWLDELTVWNKSAWSVQLPELTSWFVSIVFLLVAVPGYILLKKSFVNARRKPQLAATSVVLFSSVLLAGCPGSDFVNECASFNENGSCEEYKRAAVPVYMSLDKLRNSVVTELPRAPDNIGRLYLYGDFVFLNEKNEGIHIIDNSDQTAPVNLAFIRIPGNTEIAVRDNYLYADSYIDLITLDIRDPQNMAVVSREQSIFPYDATQNIPQNITFTGSTVDRSQGVVVSYRLTGS